MPAPDRVLSGAWAETPRVKPPTFFTSTWDPGRRSMAWLDFMSREASRGGELPARLASAGHALWLLEPDPKASLFVIDSFIDFKELTDGYPHPFGRPLAPDWRGIAETHAFDGVHVTENAINQAQSQRFGPYVPFYGWDVESTAWFAFAFTAAKRVGPIAQEWTLNDDVHMDPD